jgi:hypothetical protein
MFSAIIFALTWVNHPDSKRLLVPALACAIVSMVSYQFMPHGAPPSYMYEPKPAIDYGDH